MTWISIEDSLPTSGGKFLCTDGEDISIMHYFGQYKNVSDWSSTGSITLDVTHWMLLPELPCKK